MNKKQFLQELNHQLRKIPDHDRKEMLYDFEEHFAVGHEEGKTEAEVAEQLGNPRTIARDLLVDYRINQAEKDRSFSNMSRAIFATVSLSFVNLVFLLGPTLAIAGVYIALCAVALSFTLTPLAWIGSLIFGNSVQPLTEFFVVLIIASLGVLLSVGMISVGKFLYAVLLKYVKFNLRIIKGER